MMRFSLFHAIMFLGLLFGACGGVSEEDLFQMAQSEVEQQNYLAATQHLEQLIDRFPKGKRAEESLFLLGNIYNDNLQKPRQAIAMYRRLHEMFPRGEKAPGALFLVGFIYNNVLHQYDSARIAYEQFLREYPQHEMAESAKFEIDNLGKPPEELFRTKVAEQEQPKQATKRAQTRKRQ